MYFPESEVIARKHPDLLPALQKVDTQLSTITSSAPLNPADFSSVLGAEENQVVSVFELLAEHGVLKHEEMVQCESCHNLMRAKDFRSAIDDEDSFDCTSCGHAIPAWSEPALVFRMTSQSLSRARAELQSHAASDRAGPGLITSDEPLGDRAQDSLIAMLQLGAIDSDSRKSTEQIAVAAMGKGYDANSLKAVLSELSSRQLIETKTGRSGGCWLSDTGHQRAEKLSVQRKTPQPFRHPLRTD